VLKISEECLKKYKEDPILRPGRKDKGKIIYFIPFGCKQIYEYYFLKQTTLFYTKDLKVS
jgi:hypothetical protein